MNLDKIGIVVCANETEYKVALKSKVEEDAQFSILGYAELSPSSKTRIQGFVPEVVVFIADSYDINQEFADMIEDMNLPSFGAIPVILTDDVTVDLVNMAAQAGVRQVMDIKIKPSEFCENIKRIVTKEHKNSATKVGGEKRSRSKVYAFFSGKGGVGKTTISVNSAVALATRGKKTLLIDLDLQFGDAEMALDLEPNDTIVELSRDTNGISIDNLSMCCTTHSSGLSLLASPNSPEQAEYVTSVAVKSIIEVARNNYEYILIDCGCALTDPVITALENADDIFMVNDVNILSLKRAKLCMDVLQHINQGDKVKLIINKNVKKNNVKISDYENLLRIPAYAVVSSDFKTVNNSLNNGQPAITYKSRSLISKDLNNFVNQLIMEREGQLPSKTSRKKKIK